MKEIDLNTWPRKKHFEVYNAFDYPHFNLCANLDITSLYAEVKAHGLSLHSTLIYIFSRTANDLPEFRWRIRGDKVVEHEVVHPSASIMTGDNLFSFCTIQYKHSFPEFYENAEATIAATKLHPSLEDEPGQDDLLFMTQHSVGFLHGILYIPSICTRWILFREFHGASTLQMTIGSKCHSLCRRIMP